MSSLNEGFDIIDLEVNFKVKPLFATIAMQIGELLDDPVAAAPQLRDAMMRKLGDIDARITALATLRAELARELERPGLGCPVLKITYS